MFPQRDAGVIFFDSSHEKDWTLLAKSCITIRDGAKPRCQNLKSASSGWRKLFRNWKREKSLTLFEEGMQLSSSCRTELEQAEGKVEILLKKNGKLQAEPFEALTEKSPARR